MSTDRPLLPPGTRVQQQPPPGKPRYGDLDPRHNGIVALYQMDLPTSVGSFPIRWRDGLTTICDASDVIVIEKTVKQVDAA